LDLKKKLRNFPRLLSKKTEKDKKKDENLLRPFAMAHHNQWFRKCTEVTLSMLKGGYNEP